MITLNDISMNKNTYKDILQKSYYGHEFTKDTRRIAVLRTAIHKWSELNDSQKLKARNDLTIILNIFDNEQVVRFLLSNIEGKHWFVIFSLLLDVENILDVYHNINGQDVSPIDYLTGDKND